MLMLCLSIWFCIQLISTTNDKKYVTRQLSSPNTFSFWFLRLYKWFLGFYFVSNINKRKTRIKRASKIFTVCVKGGIMEGVEVREIIHQLLSITAINYCVCIVWFYSMRKGGENFKFTLSKIAHKTFIKRARDRCKHPVNENLEIHLLWLFFLSFLKFQVHFTDSLFGFLFTTRWLSSDELTLFSRSWNFRRSLQRLPDENEQKTLLNDQENEWKNFMTIILRRKTEST